MAEKKAAKKNAQATEGAKSKIKLIVLILIVVLILGGAGGAAYYFLFYNQSGESAEEATEEQADESSEPASLPLPPQQSAPPPVEQNPVIYHSFEPITVNLATAGPVRFLRVTIILTTRNPPVIAAINKHLPRIRNDLLAQLAAQDAAIINTTEGKNALREELRTLISGILINAGEASGIQDVLFTDFIMQ